MEKQTTLGSFSFNPDAYIQIKDMKEEDLRKYCKAKMAKYEEGRKSKIGTRYDFSDEEE